MSETTQRVVHPGRMRRAVVVFLVVLACLGVVMFRAVWDGTTALEQGDTALAAKDTEGAILGWRRAARWYLPGAGHVSAAYDRLVGLARDAETRGDRALALQAWEGVRSSIKATRSFYVPFASLLPQANERIAALLAQDERSPPMTGATPEARQAWHLALLERDESPRAGWAFLALLGFAAWVGGGFLFAARGLGEDDRLVKRSALQALALIAGGLVVWVLGLSLA